jgi:hypothetical protein
MKLVSAIPAIVINFPKDGKIRSRKVVKRSNARMTGKYPSLKMQRMMQWESEHESNAMRIFDATVEVIAFNEQPCEIVYEMDGEWFRHYPDFLIQTLDGNTFCEVKMAADAASDEVAKRTAHLTQYLPYYDYQYRIELAEDLAREPRLGNLKRLLKLGRVDVSLTEKEHFRQFFKQHDAILWSDLKQDECHPMLLPQACRLILDGVLTIDLNQPISESSAIGWNHTTNQ